jgi:hypothetical protein
MSMRRTVMATQPYACMSWERDRENNRGETTLDAVLRVTLESN